MFEQRDKDHDATPIAAEVPYLPPPSPEVVQGLREYMNEHAELVKAARERVMAGAMARRYRPNKHPNRFDTYATDERQGLVGRFGHAVTTRLFRLR